MTFRERLASREPLLLDGGMGSALISRGLRPGSPPELWNVERPDSITEVHRGFVESGSDAVQTNTFGGNPVRLAAHGVEHRCVELNRAAVERARAARPTFVIGDIGPTGEYLPPVGHGDPEGWAKAFECQAGALAEAGVDAFHVETMSDIREACAALEAVRRVAPGIPVMVSMTFERRKRGFFTVMGNPVIDSLKDLVGRGADAVGANCSIASGDMRALVEQAVTEIEHPFVAQPNAGSPVTGDDGVARYEQTPDAFADDMQVVASHGVSVLGGCCGTDSKFIEAMKRRLGEQS